MRFSRALLLFACIVSAGVYGAGCGKSRTAPAKSADTETKEKEHAMTRAETQPQHLPGAFPPQVAGAFYTGDAQDLRRQVERYIAEGTPDSTLEDRHIVGLISPHAGYQYSGPVAGEAFAQVQGRNYKTVFVLALNHRRGSSRLAVLDRPAYDTPLGSLPIDQQAVRHLVDRYPGVFEADEMMFRMEHSLEVELPFIQVALPEARIVPMIVAVHEPEIVARAGRALFETYGQRGDVLFVMSSDLSHYFPYDEAVEIDRNTLKLLTDWSMERWKQVALSREGMCGYWPILTYANLFEGYPTTGRKVTLLDYRNSGDTSGAKEGGVVGYGAVAFSVDESVQLTDAAKAGAAKDFGPFDRGARSELMALAKSAVRAAAKGEPFEPRKPKGAQLGDLGAAFVTLRKSGELRGCIGHVMARVPLYKCVADVAMSAALHDTRFPPVTEDELSQLTYEISVLTAPQPTTPDQVVVGRDGLIISMGMRSGLLLPQVPVEWNWDREEFLSHTCRKAGLPLDCWRDEGVEIKSFRAIVFGEGDI